MPALLIVPFAGLLLSIAILPGLAPRFWERRMGWIAAGWSLSLIPLLGLPAWFHTTVSALLDAWLPFATVISGLYIAAGGILLRGGPAGRPWGNTMMLARGVVLSLIMGPAGASMVVLHPLLHANAHRRRKFHLVLFLILLVANTAAVITPLGNPPLLAGLLRGVPFLWPAQTLFGVWATAVALLLGGFFAVDWYLARAEPPAPPAARFSVRGWGNAGLVLLMAGSVMLPVSPVFAAVLGGAVSLWITPRAVRRANDFSWHPMLEVAILFAGIFVTLEPVSALLRQGLDGPFASVLRVAADDSGVMRPALVFWMVGVLSAFLDNAPAYLVFFDLAGIRPEAMTETQTAVLRAISAGAVMFGGLTYIGNAPNMMLRTIAAHRGVRMPGFFLYMYWASLVLVPVLVLVSLGFFAR